MPAPTLAKLFSTATKPCCHEPTAPRTTPEDGIKPCSLKYSIKAGKVWASWVTCSVKGGIISDTTTDNNANTSTYTSTADKARGIRYLSRLSATGLIALATTTAAN